MITYDSFHYLNVGRLAPKRWMNYWDVQGTCAALRVAVHVARYDEGVH